MKIWAKLVEKRISFNHSLLYCATLILFPFLFLSCEKRQSGQIKTVVLNLGNAHSDPSDRNLIKFDVKEIGNDQFLSRFYSDRKYFLVAKHNAGIKMNLSSDHPAVHIERKDTVFILKTGNVQKYEKFKIYFITDTTVNRLLYHHMSFVDEGSNEIHETLIEIDTIGSREFGFVR